MREVERIGLTGGIATGKSYVRSRFDALGVPTIEADVLAREAVAPGSLGLQAVVARFGAGVLDGAGALDRRALGAIVFADPVARHDLERIIHPFVRARTDEWFRGLQAGEHPFAVADIPLLFETGGAKDYGAVVVTACDPETQVRRVMVRDRVTEADARRRVAAQWPVEEKVRLADYVIRTDGSHDETDRQVGEVLTRLRAARR